LVIIVYFHSAQQARSFASFMHNDDKFLQYFALDFGTDLMAVHGGNILKIAAFTNEAINFINSLYEKKFPSKG